MAGAPLRRLVERAVAGDQQAWDEIVRRFEGLVWATVRSHRLARPEADDVVQTVWLRVVEHLVGIREPERLGAWLATTARRESLRHLKHAGRTVPAGDAAELEPEAPDAPPVDADLLRGERDRLLWSAFARLSARCQALLRLLVGEPAPSYEEVSIALEMPIGSIGPTRARCLERLRGALGEEGLPPALVDPA